MASPPLWVHQVQAHSPHHEASMHPRALSMAHDHADAENIRQILIKTSAEDMFAGDDASFKEMGSASTASVLGRSINRLIRWSVKGCLQILLNSVH